MVAHVGAAHLLHLVQAVEEMLVVMPHAARLVVHDVHKLRAVRLDLEQLVHLLLVLDDGELDLGVLQHKQQFLRHRVLVHGHRHAAQALRRGHGPIQPRPVVADDREVVAALEADLSQAAGERAHFVRDLAPGPGLPDAEVFSRIAG